MSNILNEINLMKYLTQYKRGVVISEQLTNLNEGKLNNCVSDFQNWVMTSKGDSQILGNSGVDGLWGPNTKAAFDTYGTNYPSALSDHSNFITKFQDYVKNVKKDSSILGSTGVDGDWGPSTKNAWLKYGSSYLSVKCQGGSTKTKEKEKEKENSEKSCKKVNIKNFESINTCLANPNKSTKLGSSDVTDCAAFVNAFSKNVSYVGNAWFTHDLDSAGKRKFSVYTTVPETIKQNVRKIFNAIWKRGGWQKASEYSQNIKNLQDSLVPNQSSLKSKLVKGDLVGIYYPPSSHHVEAFYQSVTGKDGKGNAISPSYVKVDSKGNMVKGSDGYPSLGKTWSSGRIWSPNTHLGIVGEVKNGTPIIFHNIGGTVWADPLGSLQGGGKIMWIKQP